MPRIAILGNSAGGKSTLARHLAIARKLPRVEIDDLFWMPDWRAVPRDIFMRNHQRAIDRADWIIDGGGYMAAIESRVARATELILLDLPLWVHYWRAAERQVAWATGKLAHPPSGGRSMPSTGPLFEMMWKVDREAMPRLRRLCDESEAAGKTVVRLNTLDELAAFSADATSLATRD